MKTAACVARALLRAPVMAVCGLLKALRMVLLALRGAMGPQVLPPARQPNTIVQLEKKR